LESRQFGVYWIDKQARGEIFQLAREVGKDLSFADYCVIYLARKEGSRVLCFDRQLARLAQARGN